MWFAEVVNKTTMSLFGGGCNTFGSYWLGN